MNIVSFQDAAQGRMGNAASIPETCPPPSARGVAFCLGMLEQEARGIGLTFAAHLIAVARQAVDEEATLAAG